MRASNCRLGKRLKQKETKDIFEVQEVDGEKVWVDIKLGDIHDWLDEDLFWDLDYYTK